jgi:UDP-glucose 4-epimerase
MKTRHVLVTGGAGFIGSHVCEALLASGYRVTVIDDLSSGVKSNLSYHPKLNFQKCDVLQNPPNYWPSDVDVIVHLAAIASVAQSWSTLKRAHEVNVSSTVHLLEVSMQLGISRFVLASSAAVYGNPGSVPLHETVPLSPLSPYGLHKLISEQYGSLLSQKIGMTFVALRLFNVFGPRQLGSSPYAGVIARYTEALRRGGAMTLRGDGRQTRDFVYVKDVAEAVVAAASVDLPKGTFIPINIGSGRATSILELAEMMRALYSDGSVPIIFESLVLGEIRESCANIIRAKETLGFSPRWSLRDGLGDLLKAAP